MNGNTNLGLINSDNLFYVSNKLVASPKYKMIAINNTIVMRYVNNSSSYCCTRKYYIRTTRIRISMAHYQITKIVL